MGDTTPDAHATWLSLLAADADPAELERHGERLAAAAEGELEQERVRVEARQAAVVSARLEDRRRQAREVTALNHLARRLASLHETDELLHEVAAQSRHLLGVDVAYIMVRQDDRTLRIEAADGSMGSALRGIVLEEGEGVGGEVMRTGRPLWSRSYLEDPRLRRVQAVDAAASSEQLGGILGVPLQVDDVTLGVLCAAERRPRRFADREIELLAALAAHAAVALRNAQLFGRHQQALAELRASNANLRDLDARRQRATELRENLTATVIRGGGVPEVAEVITRVIGGPVLVLDAQGVPLAQGPADDDLRPGSTPSGEWFEAGPTARRDEGGRALLVSAVALRDGYAGCLVARSVPGFEEETARLLEIGAASVALVVASEQTVAEAELRTRGEFTHALLSRDVDPTSIRRRARAVDIDLDGVRAVAVLDPGTADDRAAARLGSRLATELGGWSAEHAGHVVVLVPAADATGTRARLVALADGRLPGAIGVADCVGGTVAVRTAHEAARQTAVLLLALGRPHAAALPAEVGVYRGLFSTAGRGEIAAYVEATLGELVDRDRGRDLVGTLDAYLRNAQHHARTCGELHVHANTLYNRLERIGRILGPGWRAPERVLELQLALQMRLLMARVPGDAEPTGTGPLVEVSS